MNREGKVFFQDKLAGKVWQDDTNYGFVYDEAWLGNRIAQPVSLTLPLRAEPYLSETMIPFFDGLIPEGWLLEITREELEIGSLRPHGPPARRLQGLHWRRKRGRN